MDPIKTFSDIFLHSDTALQYLKDRGVLEIPETCPICGNTRLSFYKMRNVRCTKKNCRHTISITKTTFFEKQKMELSSSLELAYYWLAGVKAKSLQIITGHSTSTITEYFKQLRNLVSDSLDFEDLIIGGEQIIVEVDEAKFGKNKYHRGHPVNGAWVLGGVERTAERKMFLIEVPDRTANTLLSAILTHVRPGSIVITDCFRSYSNLHEYFVHQTVNHSVEFVDSESGACTNTIEGSWNGIKMKIAPRNRTSSFDEDGNLLQNGIDDHLGEFQWRRIHAEDLWGAFIDALINVRYI